MTNLKPGAPLAVGYVAVPEGGEGPGVLVLHAWWGLNGFFRGLCDRLAEAGFVAVAPDLWGGAVAATVEEAEALIKQRDGAAMAAAVTGALDHLRAHPAVSGGPLGAIGFSMGAAWAVDLSAERPADLRAAALFYGAGEADFTMARAAYLGHFVEGDPWEPDEYVLQMEADMAAAGREVTIHRYAGVGHWFFEADRPDAYDPAAAALAWERTLAFLRQHLS